MTFCDVSSFYTPTGGGIRTYHRAKLDWFSAQRDHQYYLLVPGPRHEVTRVSTQAAMVTFYGAPVRAGYRLPLDLSGICRFIADLRPDVIETGDPWISGPLGLWCRRKGYATLLSSFYHSDPIATYFVPDDTETGLSVPLRRGLGDLAGGLLWYLQRRFDLTLTSSEWVEHMLISRGIDKTTRVPFGVDPAFFHVGRARRSRRLRTRLLYVGRLQADKGFDVLLDTLPELLQLPDVSVTVVGSGPLETSLRAISSPALRVEGFVSSRPSLAGVFAEHDVLLAPGPYETFGLAALEGLAAGLSLVAPDAGGSAELLRALPSPHVFRRHDRTDFVRAVRDAVDADGRDEADAAVGLAEQYGTWSDAIARQVEVYCNCLSRCTT